MRKQLGSDQIVKIIEREQVISYKKKNQKIKVGKEGEQEGQSVHSIKSHVFSDESSKLGKRNLPLPELARQKYSVGNSQTQDVNKDGYQELITSKKKQGNMITQYQNQNNELSTENMRLKTRLMTLEKENLRLQKVEEPSHQNPVVRVHLPAKDIKLSRHTDTQPLKLLVRNLRKDLDDAKTQNSKIKCSVKFTRISELECQKELILEESKRLRQLLEEELSKRANLKIKEHGMNTLGTKLNLVQDRNSLLLRENAELHAKLKHYQDNNNRVQRFSENEKNLNRMLFNAKRAIREKEKIIETLKSASSLTQLPEDTNEDKPAKQNPLLTKINNSKEKRIMSKSAQKYRSAANKNNAEQCENCKKLKDQIIVLERKIQQLSQPERTTSKNMGEIRKCQIQKPSPSDCEVVGRFLTFRFKAHHLNLEDAEKYLLHTQNSPVTNQDISIGEVLQSSIAEPFSILSSYYLESFLTYLFFPNELNPKVTLNEQYRIPKSQLIINFKNIVKQYQLMTQAKEEQMFIQIAELVTNYHQHILTALNGKRNGDGTIAEKDLTQFFNQIQLQKEYVDFIITQIVLQSYDLGNLNYYAMFEIFYMPTPEVPLQQKNKFQVDHVVKQQDQQYQESRSYVDTKQKTLENNKNDDDNPVKEGDDDYQQLFEEEKVLRAYEQQKINSDEKHKPYQMEEQVIEYDQQYERQ